MERLAPLMFERLVAEVLVRVRGIRVRTDGVEVAADHLLARCR
jgi:hypothetical protein